ncbi:MAG: OadG family protein [Bacteroidales bacterium]|nr:OadG family protein [Bacteroidales bacterium]
MLLEIFFDIGAIDVFALIVALVGYVVVFIVLILMFTIYNNIPKILNIKARQRMRKRGKKECEPCEDISGEVNAAISTALHLYLNELHDEESDVMTIKKISKRYSPELTKFMG